MSISEYVRDWFPFVSTLFGVVAAVAAGWVRREALAAIASSEAKVIESIDDHHDRLGKLEAAAVILPTRADFHTLALANADMIGEMKAIKEAMKGMHETVTATRASVQRVNDYLLEHKK